MVVIVLKVVASALVVLTTTAIGFSIARRYRDRPRHLRQLQSALQSLATEISYGATPLPEAFASLASSQPAPTDAMFRAAAISLRKPGTTAAEAWQVGLERLLQESAVSIDDLAVIRQLGAVLGLSDRRDQERHLLLVVQHLQREEVRAEHERLQNERMWRYLGVLSGLLIVIVLV
ncbi:MAG TPA: stage III sporulation protein AB [Firmicutes bacterium]|jgi:stage III sporulation protein AB|nr:stage III sporulation protein AB [Bacillota bacterium]